MNFIEGLTKYPIMPYKEISDKMDEGAENRTLDSTVMNIQILVSI